jgi:cytochrome d ubiquinol oxidase subunit II
LTPYGLWLGLTLLMLCLLHGATFLGLKSGGAVRARSKALAARLVWLSLLLVVVYAAWTVSISDGGFWRVLALIVPGVAAIGAAVLIRAGHQGASFVATAVTIGGTVAALFANLYPDVMVSSTTTANNLTAAGTASGEYALKVMTVVAAVMFPVVLLYQGWSYWVFRARINTQPRSRNGSRALPTPSPPRSETPLSRSR